MYERITGESPWETPMKIYPAPHYSMGGLWVDYELQTTIPGPVRDRRGELLRPRRQPARRQRDDAVPRRRLLHRPAHGHQLRSAGSTTHVDTDDPAFDAAERDVRDRLDAAARRRRHDAADRLPPRARRGDARQLRHHPRRRGAAARRSTGSREIRDAFWSRPARSSPATAASTRRSSTPAGSPTSSSWPS